jgi:hypothetical protein
METTEFTTGQIHPIECAKEGWQLIQDEYWILFAVSLVGAMIGGATMYVLIGAMICGIFGCYLKKIDGGRVAFEDLFKGFQFFWPSLGVTIAIVVPLVGWILLMFVTLYLPLITAAVVGDKGNGGAILGTFAVVLVIDLIVAVIMICFHSLLIFCFPLIVDRGLTSMESIKLSARAVMKNLGGVGGLIAVNFVMALAGELAFCIGLYLVIPIITVTNLVAFRKVFPKQGGAPTPFG